MCEKFCKKHNSLRQYYATSSLPLITTSYPVISDKKNSRIDSESKNILEINNNSKNKLLASNLFRDNGDESEISTILTQIKDLSSRKIHLSSNIATIGILVILAVLISLTVFFLFCILRKRKSRKPITAIFTVSEEPYA